MTVWIVIEHIDKGSDEFRVAAVFDEARKAREYLQREYIDHGWQPLDEDLAEDESPDPEDLVYYQDGDDMNDDVRVEREEVL
jgi:hypothetical protein